MKQEYLSTTEVAEILGLSRIQVFRLIKSGKLPAEKIGRNFAINRKDLGVYGGEISNKEKKSIEKSVDKVIDEYGDVIRKLGEE